MFSITSLSDGKVKSFTELNCQLLFTVFSYVSIFLFVPSVEFLCSVQILALFDNKQGTGILTQGMQTHLISHCLCVTHLRSISALKICPSKRPHCSNIFAPVLKVWRHEIQILTLLDEWQNLCPHGGQYLSFFCRSFATCCWTILFFTSFGKAWHWSSSSDCSHCTSFSAFSFSMASERQKDNIQSTVMQPSQ